MACSPHLVLLTVAAQIRFPAAADQGASVMSPPDLNQDQMESASSKHDEVASTKMRATPSTAGEQELEKTQQKLQQATADAISATRSLEREIKLQKTAVEELRTSLEARQHEASASLATTAKLISALQTPSVLWGEVVRDIAQLGDARGQDEVVRALQESCGICESFIGQGADEELVKRIDEVIEMLGGD